MVIIMENIVLKNIKEQNLIEEGDTIVIGVSGGHDSMCLMDVMYRLKDRLKLKLIIAHVNHGVRGRLAKRDQLFVEKEANKLNLEYHYKEVDMYAFARKKQISAEEAGRILRYNFFNSLLENNKNGKIAVAHNKNDQAETLLMRIFRGTGLEGLQGIKFKNGNVIRPLLNISREEIENYIVSRNINVVIDHTNTQSIYTRNKIRLDLIPYLERNFNPNLIDSLWRLSENSKLDMDIISDSVMEKYSKISKRTGGYIEIDRFKFLKLEKSFKNRIIRQAIKDLIGHLYGIKDINVEDGVKLIENGRTGKSIDLPNNLKILLSYGKIIIYIDEKEQGIIGKQKLRIGENIIDNYKVNLAVLNRNDLKDHIYKDSEVKAFDLSSLKFPLYIRTRVAGDRFTPLGMSGTKKIKDYFIDKKVPRIKRDRIPLVVDSNDNIVWVIGYCINDKFKLVKNTKKVLLIKTKYKKGV